MSPPKLRLPIGQSDFRMLRQQGLTYVDKSAFIVEVLEASAQAILVPRPRRFGKTLNLSMLRYWLERGLERGLERTSEDCSGLFAGLVVEQSELARAHRQRHPVMFLTFKDVKESSWEGYLARMAGELAALYREHSYLLDGAVLQPQERDAFTAILHGSASAAKSAAALRDLSRWLALHHGEPVVILIDEYDTPLHAAYHARYYDQAVGHLRSLLSGGLKDNPHLFKGVLTGILRVAKESIFSGLNNLAVYSILRTEFATSFGFTEPEVVALAEQGGSPEAVDGIREWYDGYRFGGQTLYNPWSVINYLDSADREFRPYWIATSSNDLVRELLISGPQGLRAELETLLTGGVIDKPIEEHVVLRDIETTPDAVWGFLLFSGYLRARETYTDASRTLWARLDVPNLEVHAALATMVRNWMSVRVGGSSEVQALLQALLRGDARSIEHYLSRMMKVSLSYHDTGGPEPERVIHGFIVGLLVALQPEYEVRSNRESGYGRYDVMVLPRTAGKPGVVVELQTVDDGEAPASALEDGLRQLRERDYATELRERGASPIIELAAAFDGKRAFVARAGG
ncbi:AAA family ATPase [Paraliomyxa miuraensis]|uniref:AAA family ATPase n=1 Tax=Paraliomyxa miuraensis TaxID=376150 RepID=UPI0022598861|nr:AAA family ATPase [Paraliomyxa miuraensis]MCX4246308.1 ATP-binding protein [Paraliomyxa miuraensis]